MGMRYAIEPRRSVVMLNTDALYTDTVSVGRKGRNVSEFEAVIVRKLVAKLAEFGVRAPSIGIMAPYRSQLKKIKSKLESMADAHELFVDTIDRFQGSDRDVILLSFAQSPLDQKIGEILKDWRRVNVALTRAKKKLILLASVTALQKSEVLNQLVAIAREK